MSRVEMEFRRLIQIADPSIRVDRLSPAEVITEGLRLSQLAVSELAKKLDAMERADSEEDGDRLYLVRKSTLLEHGILPEEAHYDSNPRMDGSEPTRKVITWNGVRIGVTHVAGEDYRFGQRVEHDYGRIYGSYGHAGDKRSHDVIIGKNLDSPKIFAIQQLDGIKRDEVKYGIGFNTGDEFAEAYRSPMPNGMRDKLFGGVWEVDPSEFDPYRSDSRSGLVKKKIKVKGKKGEYESTRWVRGGGAAKAIIAGGVVAGLGATGLAMSLKGKQQAAANPVPIPGKSGGTSNRAKAVIGGAIAAGSAGVAGVALSRKVQGKGIPEKEEEANQQDPPIASTIPSGNFDARKVQEDAISKGTPLTQDELDSIAAYTGSGYANINDALSGKQFRDFRFGEEARDARKLATDLDSALRKLPRFDGKATRLVTTGVDADGDEVSEVRQVDISGQPLNRYVGMGKSWFDSYEEGGEFVEPRAVSTSALKEPFNSSQGTMANHADRDNLGVFRIKYKGDGQSNGRVIHNPNEAEVLFPPGTKFRVVRKTEEDIEVRTGKKGAEGKKRRAYVIELEEV